MSDKTLEEALLEVGGHPTRGAKPPDWTLEQANAERETLGLPPLPTPASDSSATPPT